MHSKFSCLEPLPLRSTEFPRFWQRQWCEPYTDAKYKNPRAIRTERRGMNQWSLTVRINGWPIMKSSVYSETSMRSAIGSQVTPNRRPKSCQRRLTTLACACFHCCVARLLVTWPIEIPAIWSLVWAICKGSFAKCGLSTLVPMAYSHLHK